MEAFIVQEHRRGASLIGRIDAKGFLCFFSVFLIANYCALVDIVSNWYGF